MRNATLAASLFALFISAALAPPALAYERPDAVSLAGEWELCTVKPALDIVDPQYRQAVQDFPRPDFPTLAPSLEQVVPSRIRPPRDVQWQPVTVPGAWELAAGIDYNGAGWYRRTLDIPAEWLAGGAGFQPTDASGGAGVTPADMPGSGAGPGAERTGGTAGASAAGTVTGDDAGATSARRVWLEFDAVSCAAGVWLNGKWLGGHVGDFSRWRVELTSAAKPGPNELWVYVDELPGHVTQGFLCIIMPHHGGIWQDVRMYPTGKFAVEPDGIWIKANPQDGTVEAEIALNGKWSWPENPVELTIVRLNPGAENGTPEVVFTSTYPRRQPPAPADVDGNIVRAKCRIEDFKLWNPETPCLYEATITIAHHPPAFSLDNFTPQPLSDYVTQRFAFRDVHTEGSQLILNGQPVSFRAALNWGSYPRIVSPSPSPEIVRDEFRQMKKLGFNAETVCLIMLPDWFYDIADEEGMLLWQEYPTWHATFDRNDAATYIPEFKAYFRRDRMHPSILLRSMSCEAGVADNNVMPDLYWLSKTMTGTPSQDNTSWFWLSNPDIADWYDEHNYYTCAQWEKYLLKTLPTELDSRPAKPFLIGESIIASGWPDTDALFNAVTTAAVQGRVPTDYLGTPRDPLPNGITGSDEPSLMNYAPRGGWPYWFPRCYDSMLQYEDKLRAKYNALLPAKQDIIRDYLRPQSLKYALDFRRFQIELMYADPRYTGYTINTVRDVPLVRAGLLDDLGRPRWTPEEWAWHGPQTKSPVKVGEEVGDKLLRFNPDMLKLSELPPPCFVLSEGYRDLHELFAGWVNVQWVSGTDVITLGSGGVTPPPGSADFQSASSGGGAGPGAGQIGGTVAAATQATGEPPAPPVGQAAGLPENATGGTPAPPTPAPPAEPRVLVTSVLTNAMVDYIADGGVVLLLASKWPGAFATVPHMFWRDQPLVPPVGLWAQLRDSGRVPEILDTILELQHYDLTRSYSQVVPVKDLGIEDEVDPLLRLFDTHDMPDVWTFDQLCATRCGSGMLLVSSLDHSTPAGQWLLSELVRYGDEWSSVGATHGSPDTSHIAGGSGAGPGAEQTGGTAAAATQDTGKLPAPPDQDTGETPAPPAFPATSMTPERLKQFAVARANGVLALDEGWSFILDPEQQGEQLGYQTPGFDASRWDIVRAGVGWESLGYDYDGMAWYRRVIDAPADWAGCKLRLVADGIDDAYTVWVNGQAVATHGSFTKHDETVWLKQTLTDLTGYIIPGQPNTLALEVVDITGQGGIWKPVYVTVE